MICGGSLESVLPGRVFRQRARVGYCTRYPTFLGQMVWSTKCTSTESRGGLLRSARSRRFRAEFKGGANVISRSPVARLPGRSVVFSVAEICNPVLQRQPPGRGREQVRERGWQRRR